MPRQTRTEIIPAILPRDFAEITEKIDLIKGFVKTVQIDICDGHFVKSFTWPYKKHDDSFEKMLHEQEGMPAWKELDYEFDLMVDYPEKVVDEWVTVGALRIIIHAESKGDVVAAINKLSGRAEIGLAFNIDTPVEIPASVAIDSINSIQLMGIDHVGYQGQSFDDKVIDKIKSVRAKFPDMAISVDGAVSLETAPLLIAAGANRLIIGSAIFESDNPIDAIAKFKSI
ncbi:MAG: hypothetical protein WCO48_03110 [Candidatus Taylorbacteria bacterium]